MDTNNRKVEIQLIHIANIHKDLECDFRVLINDEEAIILDMPAADRLHIGAMLLHAGKSFIRNSIEKEQHSVKRKKS